MGEKEKRAKIRLTVEMDIDAGEHPNVTEEEVKNAVVLRDSDAVDGFEITTDDLRFDNTSDFFLKNGRIVEKELLTGDGNLQLTEKRRQFTIYFFFLALFSRIFIQNYRIYSINQTIRESRFRVFVASS